MANHGKWDEKRGEWVYYTKYNFSLFEPLLRDHFEAGGSATIRVIAGICCVGVMTVHDWLNKKHREYHPEFASLVNEYRHVAAKITDDAHRDAALGNKKILNEKTLNRRFEKLCEGIEKRIKSTATYTEKLRVYTEAFLNNEINSDTYSALTKGMADRDVEAAIEKMEKLISNKKVQKDKTKEVKDE